jgi:ESS family glutamate:Na+ symporter
MNFSWTLFIDLGLIAFALLIATLIRATVPFFQRYLIPNAITAGFILLPFYNFVAPLLGHGTGGLENLVYHLLTISFISMSLKSGSMKGSGRRVFATAITVISHYTLQVVIGLGLTLLFIKTVRPDLFLNLGFLLPLGYGLGPGQAFAIAKPWESAGFTSAANLGLIFAAMGYLWACIGGVWLINHGLRKGWLDKDAHAAIGKKSMRVGIVGRGEKGLVGAILRTDTEAIDSLSYHLVLVLGVYLLAYFVLKLVTWPLLAFAGTMGRQLAETLWGISFVFGSLVAMAVKRLMQVLKIDHTLDEGTFNRIAGGAVDIMVTAALAAIAITTVAHYWLPIATISIIGGAATLVGCLWMTSRLFDSHKFGRAIMMYGNMTGTLSTGIALLRIVDPEFETPVAEDYMFSNGITFALAIPMILLLNQPINYYLTGNTTYLWITYVGFGAYIIFSLVAYTLLAGKRAFAKFTKVWYTD